MKEIVAAQIGSTITNNPALIADAVKSGDIKRLIQRAELKFMAACDLGGQWDRLSESKTLFRIDENGDILPPTDNREGLKDEQSNRHKRIQS